MKQRRSKNRNSAKKVQNAGVLSNESIGEFIDAVVQDHDAARRLLSAQPQLLNARWRHDETALHFLAVEGFTEGVKFLADCGADVNTVNEFGDTALMDVATLGNAEIAEILLRYGANSNARSPTRNNVLDCAVRAGSAALVSMLLHAGADPRYVTDIGESIFEALPRRVTKRQQILEVLARHGIVPGV